MIVEKRISDYQTIQFAKSATSTNCSDFNIIIFREIQEGWQPYGPLSFNFYVCPRTGPTDIFVQVMVKYE